MRAANRFLRIGVAPILILAGISIFAVSLAHAQDGNYVMLLSAGSDGIDLPPGAVAAGSFQYIDVPAYITISGNVVSGSGTDPNGLPFTLSGTYNPLPGILDFTTHGPGLCVPGSEVSGGYVGRKQGNSALGSVEWFGLYYCDCLPPGAYPCGCAGLWEGTFTASFQPYGVGGGGGVGGGSLVEGDMAVVGRGVTQRGAYHNWEDEPIPLVAGQDADILLKIIAKLVPEAFRTVLVKAWLERQDVKGSTVATLGEQSGTVEGQELEVVVNLRPRKGGDDRLWVKAEPQNDTTFERNTENNQTSVSVSVEKRFTPAPVFILLE